MPGNADGGAKRDDRYGDRFFSLANAFATQIIAPCFSPLRQRRDSEGVFVSYPSELRKRRAEIRMMQIIGGDVVGMLVVPEVISARHCGLKV